MQIIFTPYKPNHFYPLKLGQCCFIIFGMKSRYRVGGSVYQLFSQSHGSKFVSEHKVTSCSFEIMINNTSVKNVHYGSVQWVLRKFLSVNKRLCQSVDYSRVKTFAQYVLVWAFTLIGQVWHFSASLIHYGNEVHFPFNDALIL